MKNKNSELKNKNIAKPDNAGLPDFARDEEKLKPDEATLNLPDVKDIPGQEHIHVPPLGEIADTTISSDDEEGEGVFDQEEYTQDAENDNDITDQERELLDDTDEYLPGRDDKNLQDAALDNTDQEGEPLNEESFAKDHTAEDLDVPGSEQDDAMEKIGEEDEENNDYSLGSDSNDNATEGTP